MLSFQNHANVSEELHFFELEFYNRLDEFFPILMNIESKKK